LSKKPNRTGRGGKEARHVRLHHWMTDSAAWHDLSVVARAIYPEIAKRYNGSNNGQISYSAREAADELHISKTTAWESIKTLTDHGFIVEVKKGAFSRKNRHATEWRLTEFPCDVTHEISTKDFMRWNGSPRPKRRVLQKQNTGTQGEPTGTQGEPNGYSGRTELPQNSSDGYSGRTVEGQKSISRVLRPDTYSLPCTGDQPEHGIGHNLGPPLDSGDRPQWSTPVITELDRSIADDLTIPEFLRRDQIPTRSAVA
jgi:hypothetical protein